MYLDKPEPVEMDRVTINAVIHNVGEAPASPAVVEFLVNDEVVDMREQSLDVSDRLVATFTWTAEGDRNYLSVRVRPGHSADPDDLVVKTVDVIPNSPPIIIVEVYPIEVIVEDPVNFINNQTSDPNEDKLSFLWDFGDGFTSTDATTQHVYLTKGTYTAKLTVSDTRGGESTEQWLVTVKKKPVDEEPVISMVMLGGIALAVIVILVVAFLVMGRRRKTPGADDDDGDATTGPEEGERKAPNRRHLPPPPPPPPPPTLPAGTDSIPGSPLEELDNPYYQYDYGPGVEDPPQHDEGHDTGHDPGLETGSENGPEEAEAPADEGYDPSLETSE